MESAEKDIYKREGQIVFKIEKLSEFACAPDETERLSDAVFVRGLAWRILAINESFEQTRHLSYYLQCNVDNPAGFLLSLAQNLKKKSFIKLLV